MSNITKNAAATIRNATGRFPRDAAVAAPAPRLSVNSRDVARGATLGSATDPVCDVGIGEEGVPAFELATQSLVGRCRRRVEDAGAVGE